MAADERKDTKAVADMLTALTSAETRRVLMRILVHSNLMQASYRESALATAYNEGLRAVGLWLKKEIDRADPEAFSRLLAEGRKQA